ncbi:MAG: hypothetical protein E6Q26_04810 [Acinetobacter sp.]|nr:hypothetical protein [Acinetobacter sp.]MBP6353529.1 hypothetical protein [Acinetobacter sp.]MBP7217428.1 hypothetical protein [Acinetobacter sp.]TXJ02772.1 MAG: hypothetical protein E6Q26_04810 [Acinetobacter sp.]
MSQQAQKELFDALAQQAQQQLLVTRVLKVVLPIMAFLLSMICANLNWQSTLATFVMLTVAFYAVGIYRLTLWHWLSLTALYVFADHYLSFSTPDLPRLRFQLFAMLGFVLIVGVSRPYIDRWLTKKP